MKNFTEFNPTSYNTYSTSKRKNYSNQFDLESDDILTFDIEVSSGWVEEGEVIPYIPGRTEAYWNSLQSISLCYIWQFSFNEEIYYGRELSDFIKVLAKLPSNCHFIIWVHNLSYEFHFLQNIFPDWDSVFARQPHKPMKAITALFPNVEFRCSYTLTRLSLEAWGKKIGCEKAVGSLDYSILRTPLTELTEEELFYCERDCEVVYKGIMKYREKYKHVTAIPLTQTGEIRKVVKKIVSKNNSLKRHLLKLIPKNAEDYKKLKKVFQGGYTHANYLWAGQTVYDGRAFDFASSYPYVMVSEAFPMAPFTDAYFDEELFEEYAFLVKVRLTNVEAKTFNHYISYSKCENEEEVLLDNGRIIEAKKLEMWITEQDWLTIKETYDFKYEILECYRSAKGYLPKELIEYILELYCNKTSYKDVPGYEEIYAQSKQFINSLFGMCVTDLTQDEVVFDGHQWYVDEKTTEDVENFLKDLIEDNRNRTFLAYQWGPWITAYARRNLWKCLLTCDKYVIYCDTDSLKILGDADFSWYNEEVDKKLKETCDFYKIDFEKTRPADPKGVKHPLGYFSEEDPWSEFKTLGAKRYCYRSKKDGILHLTVSGINKDAVLCLNDDIENFNEDTIFEKDFQISNAEVKEKLPAYYDKKRANDASRGVSKKYTTYCVEQPTIKWNIGKDDEYVSSYRTGICMRPTSYSMSIADDYIELITSLERTNFLECI